MNDKLVAINRAHILALCLTSAKSVLEMFLESERINSDLDLALSFKHQWSQHFIVRKFVKIPIEYEFRAFIVDNELKAMCQYYHYIFFPTLVQNKDRIEKLILTKFDEIKSKVPFIEKTYVVDWAVDLDNNRVYTIELNPFGDYEGMGTSPCMFKLHKDIVTMDRLGPDRQLFFGPTNFEFRIEEKERSTEELVTLLHGLCVQNFSGELCC